MGNFILLNLSSRHYSSFKEVNNKRLIESRSYETIRKTKLTCKNLNQDKLVYGLEIIFSSEREV